MPAPVVTYERSLPEIPHREPYAPPTTHLRKKEGGDGYEVVMHRRPSGTLLVNRLRAAVADWRDHGYAGASQTSARLLTYWFDEDHLVDGDLFCYYFCQREAVETIIYLTEIANTTDMGPLVEKFGECDGSAGCGSGRSEISLSTSPSGERRVRRYLPERGTETTQDFPQEGLLRYAIKAATGSGKTVTAAMLMVWSYFHYMNEPGSRLSNNFLLIAPNLIVYQRLERDFASGRIFRHLPLIPPEWQTRWALRAILRGDGAEPDDLGSLFLVNIQQIYESNAPAWVPANPVDALLGPKPQKDVATQGRPMLERLKGLPHLVALNDEAHHVHDPALQWNRTLLTLHAAIPSGLSLWLDFSATPKFLSNGTFFPWIVCDYPLAQAVEDRIVKVPLIVHRVDVDDPASVTPADAAEAYSAWLRAALARWRTHREAYGRLGLSPVLFIMAESNRIADAIGKWLVETPDCELTDSEVLVIHTNPEGEVRTGQLDAARVAARDIDLPGNQVKIIVSVLMLREGWDVRNVSVVLGLRPFTSKANILPEQAVGRGLRLMPGVSPDRTQTLEVLGTAAFEDFVRQLEQEGVGVCTVLDPPSPPAHVEPLPSKPHMDIVLPLTRPIYSHDQTRLDTFDPLTLEARRNLDDITSQAGTWVVIRDVTTDAHVETRELVTGVPPLSQDIISNLTNMVMNSAGLSGCFAALYPKVRLYLSDRCFGKKVDLDDVRVRSHLDSTGVLSSLAPYLGSVLGHLLVTRGDLVFGAPGFPLSQTKPFLWRRNLPLLVANKTVFNQVATFNDFEKRFAQFVDGCPDVLRFAALGTTEQGSGTTFKVDYLKPSGAIGFYYPDFVVVQSIGEEEVNWIVETKGRVWEGTEAKDQAITFWCDRASAQTSSRWRYRRVNQSDFDRISVRGVQSYEHLIMALPR